MRDLIEDKGSEKKNLSHQEIAKKASEGRTGVGVGGFALAGFIWAWKYTRKGLTLGGRGCAEKNTERPFSAVTVAQHGVGGAQVSAWSPKPFLALLQHTLEQWGDGWGAGSAVPVAPRPRWPDSCSAQLLGACRGGGKGAAADLI